MVGSHHTQYMMKLGQADVMRVLSGFLKFTSHTVAVMRRGEIGVLPWNWWALRLQSVAEIFGLTLHLGSKLKPTQQRL